MAYTTNPKIPQVRRDVVRLVKYRGWSIRKVSRHTGFNPSTISRWCKKDPTGGWHEIPTESSRPKTNPNALPRDIVEEIVKERVGRRRCAEHVHHSLKKKVLKLV